MLPPISFYYDVTSPTSSRLGYGSIGTTNLHTARIPYLVDPLRYVNSHEVVTDHSSRVATAAFRFSGPTYRDLVTVNSSSLAPNLAHYSGTPFYNTKSQP